ncbi:hypothetical protein B0H14DRAFT_3612750, partial [Mycena olivaceomarginata]
RLTALVNRAPATSTPQPAPRPKKATKLRATDAHDVMASVLAPVLPPFHFSAPAGAHPTIPSNARGELSGSVPLFPLFHIAAPNGQSLSAAHEASGSSSRAGAQDTRSAHSNHPASTVEGRTSHCPSAAARSNQHGLPPHPPRAYHRLRRVFSRRPSHEHPSEAKPSRPAIPVTLRSRYSHNKNTMTVSRRRILRPLCCAYNVAGADVYEFLEDQGEGDEDDDDEEPPEDMDAFRRGVRVVAVKRFESNHRAGGRKTQAAMVKAWNVRVPLYYSTEGPDSRIVDEHSLLLFIIFCAERPKRTRKGIDIPGTFIGALFFGVLRIRKEQDAADPSLAKKRPATSVIVYDSIKTRMDEALERERNGLMPEEDAPDIRANTWLSQVTEKQLQDIGFGFLSHRRLRLGVWGHLAWTAQHASGNRGDDFQALKLAELQPTTLKHPDKRTDIWSVLGMQGEEKAGKRGMRTVVNPVYSVFIAPEMCPLGAFAFYFHYIYDEKGIIDPTKLDYKVNKSIYDEKGIIDPTKLDYKVNKSWQQVRVLRGPKSPTTPFNEQNLHNLYCRAYAHAGFKSRLKAHLPRHLKLLGYRQELEAADVDPLETSKLGWANLGAAGYQADEIYDPVWRKVRVPEAFLSPVCPMAEDMLKEVAGVEHLSGAFHHWQMVIELRDYLFQDANVQNWMRTGYPAELIALQAAAEDPIQLE